MITYTRPTLMMKVTTLIYFVHSESYLLTYSIESSFFTIIGINLNTLPLYVDHLQ